MVQEAIQPNTQSCRLVVESIGTARPGLAGVLAQQLGLAPAQVASTLYKAPAVLLDGLRPVHAEGLAEILEQAGLQVRIDPQEQPLPSTGSSLDLAIHLTEPDCLAECCGRLAQFLGCAPATVSSMLMNPPGVVLGDVSQATADALGSRLADLPLELLSAERQHSGYRLFIEREAGSALASLLGDLQRQGLDAEQARSTAGVAVDYRQGQYLWRRHQSAGGLRLLNEQFLRYDLYLEALTPSSQIKRLEQLAGIPPELFQTVAEQLPLVVEESVSSHALPSRQQAWAAAGMPVRAELVSLRRCRLHIAATANLLPLQQLLQDNGLLPPGQRLSLPWQSPELLGELLPRWLQQQLEYLGCEFEFEDTPHGHH